MGALRGGAILTGFFALTLPLMPVQAALLRLSRQGARRFPHWYHKRVCRLLGLNIEIEGEVATDRPVLLVANHTSWLDIPVLSAIAPVSFVAKREVGSWPFVSALARLQRSVFVDRARRSAVGEAAGEILARLAQGDAIVLFAEGTSSDGNRVLPFMTSLFAAAKPSGKSGAEAPDAVVQTLSLVYTRLYGIPLGRGDRPLVGVVRRHGDEEPRLEPVEGRPARRAHPRRAGGAAVELCRSQGSGASKRSRGARACRAHPARTRRRTIRWQSPRPRRVRPPSGRRAPPIAPRNGCERRSPVHGSAGQIAAGMLPCSMT